MAKFQDYIANLLIEEPTGNSKITEYQQEVIFNINNDKIDNLLSINWEEATNNFSIQSLRQIVVSLNNSLVQEYAIKACLNEYQCYLSITTVPNEYKPKLKCDKFIAYANELMEFVKESDMYNIKWLKSAASKIDKLEYEISSLKNVIFKKMPAELSTPEAMEYLNRLEKYCDDGCHWRDTSQKTLMCQAAYIISGLLKLDKKWKPFEDLWGVRGLASAYNKRNCRPLDDEIWSLFPEYKEDL